MNLEELDNLRKASNPPQRPAGGSKKSSRSSSTPKKSKASKGPSKPRGKASKSAPKSSPKSPQSPDPDYFDPVHGNPEEYSTHEDFQASVHDDRLAAPILVSQSQLERVLSPLEALLGTQGASAYFEDHLRYEEPLLPDSTLDPDDISRATVGIRSRYRARAEKTRAELRDAEEKERLQRLARRPRTYPENQDQWIPTPHDHEQVRFMAAAGVPHVEICKIIKPGGICTATLYKFFKDDLQTGLSRANLNISKRLYAQAMAGDVKAQKFWLERRSPGFRRTQDVHVSARPEEQAETVDYSRLSPEELEAYAEMNRRLLGMGEDETEDAITESSWVMEEE